MATFLLPGETLPLPTKVLTSLSPSLLVTPSALVALTAGVPRTTSSAVFHPHSSLPANSHLIALVNVQTPSHYTLTVPNLPQSSHFILPLEAFPGASRRHRPHLAPNAPVLVATGGPSTDPVVDCTCVFPGDADWASGQTVLGELKEGLLVPLLPGVPLNDLSLPSTLAAVAKALPPFEVAVGANGVAWVKGSERELNFLLRRWRGGDIGEKEAKEARRKFKD